MPPLVTATRSGVAVRHRDGIEALRSRFAGEHVVRLEGFLDPELLRAVNRYIDDGVFAEREDAGIARELCLQAPNRALDLLQFVLNAPQMFDCIRAIANCAPIAMFHGRVYRFDPAVPHHDSWHDDTAAGGRLAGLSLNLGGAFHGGEFQIRDKRAPDEAVTVANTGRGDAIVFAIHPGLEHRVRPVTGSAPKTALAGWFLAGDVNYWQQVLPR